MTCPCHGGCQASASRVSPVLSSASKHSIGAQFSCGLLLEVQPGTSVSGSLKKHIFFSYELKPRSLKRPQSAKSRFRGLLLRM